LLMRIESQAFLNAATQARTVRSHVIVLANEKGGSGKTLRCAICHGEGLKGLGDVPRLAGIHPIYVIRQLFNFQIEANSSTAAVA
jgi:cytochrome c553